MVCPPTNLAFLFDFQKNVLDNSNNQAVANNPVISQVLNSPVTVNQMWQFHNTTPGFYTIGNAAAGGNTAFLSYPAATTPNLIKTFDQASIQTSGQPVNFMVDCLGGINGNTAFILDSVFVNALTSWGFSAPKTCITTGFFGNSRKTWVPTETAKKPHSRNLRSHAPHLVPSTRKPPTNPTAPRTHTTLQPTLPPTKVFPETPEKPPPAPNNPAPIPTHPETAAPHAPHSHPHPSGPSLTHLSSAGNCRKHPRPTTRTRPLRIPRTPACPEPLRQPRCRLPPPPPPFAPATTPRNIPHHLGPALFASIVRCFQYNGHRLKSIRLLALLPTGLDSFDNRATSMAHSLTLTIHPNSAPRSRLATPNLRPRRTALATIPIYIVFNAYPSLKRLCTSKTGHTAHILRLPTPLTFFCEPGYVLLRTYAPVPLDDPPPPQPTSKIGFNRHHRPANCAPIGCCDG
ncbi:hypothetical protein C8J57DRAFT_1514130 [Mycena rebaudengoi]|nr:hypothetical protein C8J57DRAFT_1514130 [Mycena rebaudengoi]